MHTIAITEEDIQVVKNQIYDAYHQMKAADFTQGCQKDDCDFCRLGHFVDFEALKHDVESNLKR